MAGTLSLNRQRLAATPDPLALPASEPKEDEVPQFEPDEHYGEVGGVQGVRYVQGDNFFKPNGDFHSVAPREARLKPLTPEQEAERRKRLRDQGRKFSVGRMAHAAAAVPQKVADADKENARARAAESLSE